MRLPKVESGHTLSQKLRIGVIGLASGGRAPDVVRTLRYRKEFFGDAMSPLIHQLLRGPSDWSVGERELFAALTSRLNRCVF